MARIRTLKPEFPQSESIGRLSRDARLLFVQLWTIADDAGRLRAASRLLASLLYPYDDDASTLIESWLTELQEEGCVRRYDVDGAQYIEIVNWLKHQKIDKPSPSKIPSSSEVSQKPREASRNLQEMSPTDLGPWTLERDLGSEGTQAEQHSSESEAAPANAPKSLVSPEAIRIADELGESAGFTKETWPPGWCGAAYIVQRFLTDGCPGEIIKLAVTTTLTRRKREGPPENFTYFEKPISAAFAHHSRPLPTETPQAFDGKTNGSAPRKRTLVEAADDLLDRVRSLNSAGRTGG